MSSVMRPGHGQTWEQRASKVNSHGRVTLIIEDGPAPRLKDLVRARCNLCNNVGTAILRCLHQSQGLKCCQRKRSSLTLRAKGRPFRDSTGRIFTSIAQACETLGLKWASANICAALKGHRPSAYGLKWCYLVDVSPRNSLPQDVLR